MSFFRPELLIGGLCLIVGASSCTGDEPIGGRVTRDAGATQPSPEAGPAPEDGPACEIPTFPLDGELTDFDSLVGRVVDPSGEGVADTVAQACGTNLCLSSGTDNAGDIIPIAGGEKLANLRFKYGDGKRYAQFALPLPEQPAHDVGQQLTFALPEASPAATLDPGDVESSGIRLRLSDETEVTYDFLTRQEDRVFSAAALFEGPFPEAVAGEDLDIVLYLAPGHTKFCPPAALSVPNVPEWAPGTELEFLFHNTDVFSEWAAYGASEVVSRGRVSADGSRLETLEGEGIPVLGALGIRRR